MLEILNNINQYLYHKIEETDPILLELEAYAKEHKVPIITKEVAEYLKMMLQIKNAIMPWKLERQLATPVSILLDKLQVN